MQGQTEVKLIPYIRVQESKTQSDSANLFYGKNPEKIFYQVAQFPIFRQIHRGLSNYQEQDTRKRISVVKSGNV